MILIILTMLYVCFCVLFIWHNIKSIKKHKKESKERREQLYRELNPIVDVGGLYIVGPEEVVFFGKNQGEAIMVSNITATVLEIDVITMAEMYSSIGLGDFASTVPELGKRPCHVVFYNDRSYYVPSFYWTKHIKKIDMTQN